MNTSSITTDSGFGTLTAGTATRSQVTIGATSQFSEVSSRLLWPSINMHVQNQCNGIPLIGHPTLLCTVKDWVHNVQTGTHISGYRSYSEQATDFKLLTDILDI